MIKRELVIKAIKTLRGEVHPDPTGVIRQLTLSLRVYRDRGEFDGSIASAIECLEQAEYEIESPDACSQCGTKLKAYWLKDGVCNGCRNPHLIVAAVVAPKPRH